MKSESKGTGSSFELDLQGDEEERPVMVIIGEISASEGIDADRWLALIKSHEALANVPPRIGVNPFTRKPCEFKAPASSALVRKGGADIGQIHKAMDGSPVLVVEAEEDAVHAVVGIAADVASALGGQFVRQSHEQ